MAKTSVRKPRNGKGDTLADAVNTMTLAAASQPASVPHGFTLGWHGRKLVLILDTDGPSLARAPTTESGKATLAATSRGWRSAVHPDGTEIRFNLAATYSRPRG